jgi:hypothetical protein
MALQLTASGHMMCGPGEGSDDSRVLPDRIDEMIEWGYRRQVLAHTDEIQRSSKCRLSRVDRKWLPYGQNDATG